MNYTLKSKTLTVTVTDRGGELLSVRHNETQEEYIWQGTPAIWKDHAILLFPVCGQIVDGQYTYRNQTYHMKGHGFLPYYPMSVAETDDSHIVFTCSESEESLAQYPFPFSVRAVYTLDDERLSLRVTVQNTGSDELPFMFGWHPGFSTTSAAGEHIGDYVLRTPGRTGANVYPLVRGSFVSATPVHWDLDGEKLVLSDKMFDSPAYDTVIFGDIHTVELFCEKTGRRVRMETSGNLPYLCLWKMLCPGADYVCIEPWSGVPSEGNAPEDFSTREHMVRLPAGGTESFDYCVSFLG